jgi:hypothetical protein
MVNQRTVPAARFHEIIEKLGFTPKSDQQPLQAKGEFLKWDR